MFQVSKILLFSLGKELVKIPIFDIYTKSCCHGRIEVPKRKQMGSIWKGRQATLFRATICIFPEVKYTDNNFFNEFKRGAFKISIDHQIPIIPMSF